MASNYEMTNVKTVQVKKERLVHTLRENLTKHRVELSEATKRYDKKMEEFLAKLAKSAEKGLPGLRETHEIYGELSRLARPANHSESYEQAIALMEWETRDELELSINDFECYVRDNWNWMSLHKNIMSSYGV